MKHAQKPDHMSLNTVITRLRDGNYVIPDFQRDFEWKPWDVRDLMRSIFLDYFIGSLLLWKGKPENFHALSCAPIYGFDESKPRPDYIVLDGQQRLTALYYAFFAPNKPLPGRSNHYVYFIEVDKFMNGEHDDAFHYAWLPRQVTKLLENREAQFADHIFPLSLISSGYRELVGWFNGYKKYWEDAVTSAEENGDEESASKAKKHAEDADEFTTSILDLMDQYQVSYIELDQELQLDKVCDIFTQINSRGVRLSVFDLINALLVPKGIRLKHMWWDAQKGLEFADSERMNVYILQVMSILRQVYCSPKYLYFLLPNQEKPIRDPDGTRRKEVLVPDVEDFTARWDQAVDALEGAMKLLRQPQGFGAVSSKYLPYVSILPVFAALRTHVASCSPTLQLSAERKFRYWYWASVFTNRYSGSVESTSSRDFLDVKDWINDDYAEPALIQEFKSRFRTMDLQRETRGGTSVYNGIFNLLILKGAKDWITGNVAQPDDLDDHHIVPSSWGSKKLSGRLVHSILNRTPLTADTNRKIIGDKLPNAYLPELIEKNGKEEVLAVLETHSISPTALEILLRKPFTPDDFNEFIAERQSTLQHDIETLLVKERLDLSPSLRELDKEIERVELHLRKVIATKLDGNVEALPPHVLQKVDERLRRAAKRNGALDMEYLNGMDGKLEYCDLRELQDVILAKSAWPVFQAQFFDKEMLMSKFGQFAELRNGIRHRRTVDEVVRKEGEASLLWFNKVLGI